MKTNFQRLTQITQSTILLMLLAFYSCKDAQVEQDTKTIDPAFSSYISAFTAGNLSNSSTIEIALTQATEFAEIGEEIEDVLLEFKPKIKGKATWIDQQTIRFIPKNKLPAGQAFTAKFHLSKIMEVPDKLEVFEWDFHVRKQHIQVQENGLNYYDFSEKRKQYFNGAISASDLIAFSDLENLLTAKQADRVLPVRWEEMRGGFRFQFFIDSVRRMDQEEKLVLSWNGQSIGSEQSFKQNITIPKVGEFKLLSHQLEYEPEVCINLHFSEPVSDGQDLKGLIHLEDDAKLRMIVDNNLIKVLPVARQTEEKVLHIEEGVKSRDGFNLQERSSLKIPFYDLKPQIRLVKEGVIMPGTEGLIFPFQAVNLSAVKLTVIKVFSDNIGQFIQNNDLGGDGELKRVGRIVFRGEIPINESESINYGVMNTFALDLNKYFNAEPGAIYRVELSFDKQHSLYNCIQSDDDLAYEDADWNRDFEAINDDYTNYYFESYHYYRYFNWSEREDPCKLSYYLRDERKISSNLFASNLGLIAKAEGETQLSVFATDLLSTETLQGVDIKVYNLQNRLVGSGLTNNIGRATIELSGKAFYLVAGQGNQTGYLKVDDGSSLSLSMFETDGVKTQDGIKGMIYAERGVWRPGDSIYINFVLEDKTKVLPEGHPLEFQLISPKGKIVDRKIASKTQQSIYAFHTSTNNGAPTGNWTALLRIGNNEFRKNLKIETVKPNRLKIDLNYSNEQIRAADGQNEGTISAKWLHGAKAGGLKADIKLNLVHTSTRFEGFKRYVFDDPRYSFQTQPKTIFEGKLDDNGVARFNPDIKKRKHIPGKLLAQFTSRVFERGGDFSIDRYVCEYSPYASYVGLLMPEGKGWNNSLLLTDKNTLTIVNLDESGKAVDSKLTVELYKVDYRWWWDNNRSGRGANFLQSRYLEQLSVHEVTTKNGKAFFDLSLDIGGRYFVAVRDQKSGHSSGEVFYAYNPWAPRSTDETGEASLLNFVLDKEKYEVGQTAIAEIPSSAAGKILVSIEKQDRIIKAFWVDPQEQKTKIEIELTADMTPNAYVHISYIQPYNQSLNDRPLRLYGVQSLNVEDPYTRLSPEIAISDQLEPKANVRFSISEANKRSMDYSVAIVDEGLLDLTRFVTPDAWQHFYAKEGLGVKSWDLFDKVMGAYGGKFAGMFAVGGDASARIVNSIKANRFPPVVKMFGPFKLKKGEKRQHSFDMPNYVGAVKVMVVAADNGSYGLAEKHAEVKQPLMVLATLPRVLGPGERVQLPVSVFAMHSGVKKVDISLENNDLFTVNGPVSRTIEFTQNGDQMVYFDLTTKQKIGKGKVKVKALSGKHTSEYDIELAIRPANPEVHQYYSVRVPKGESLEQQFESLGLEGTQKSVLEACAFYPIKLDSRLSYLIKYPHGCIEQTTSSVFPQLYVENFKELEKTENEKISRNIQAGIDRIYSFQLPDGGIGYWPNAREASEWGSNYGGHFMLEAKERGFKLPVGYLESWVKYQQRAARRWLPRDESQRDHGYYWGGDLIQAYRLYTLAKAGNPEIGAMNRLRSKQDISVQSKWRLALAYQLAGHEDIARDMTRSLTTEIAPYKEGSRTFGSSWRDQAMILETLVAMDDRTTALKLVDRLSKQLNSSRWYSTQSTAYMLLGLAHFYGNDLVEKSDMEFHYVLNDLKSKSFKTDAVIFHQALELNANSSNRLLFQNQSTKDLYMTIHLSGIPLESEEEDRSNHLVMKQEYFDLNGNKIAPDLIEQGQDIICSVNIHNPGHLGLYRDMALMQIFPSGWEIHNIRMDKLPDQLNSSTATYQDIRDDRIYSYFDLKAGETKTFNTMLNASYGGSYYRPALYCEAMYDQDINALISGGWSHVVQQMAITAE